MRIRHEAGFSLIELMVAMVCTLLVTGAVYGLLTGGNNAFRREPELSDRQQNIRAAMDLIMRDIASAGTGMPGDVAAGSDSINPPGGWMQTFTPGLDGASLTTCVDNSGSSVPCPTAPSGAKTDELEIMANPNGFAPEQACNYSGGAATVKMAASTTNLRNGMVVMIIMSDGTWALRNFNGNSNGDNTSAGQCQGNPGGVPGGGASHMGLNFNPNDAQTGYNLPSGFCAGTWDGATCSGVPGNSCLSTTCNVSEILAAEVIRYRIRNGPDGVPNLERFSSASTANFNNSVRQYQVIARGIEDMQIRYLPACNPNAGQPIPVPCVPVDNAPLVDRTNLDYRTLIQSVTVTLSARSEVQNVTGVQSAPSGPTALRGSLTSVGTPRAVLNILGLPPSKRAANWVGPAQWN